MSGRTLWLPKDAAWWRRSRIVELGQEHGPAGPAVIDWLTCEAKTQNPAKGGDGSVKAGYPAIAHGTFSDVATVQAVIETCVEIGLLDDFEAHGRTFSARISGWHEDVEMPLAATRRQQQRTAATTGDNGRQESVESPDVAECPPTGQDSRGEDSTAPTSELAKASPDAIRLSALLASLILERDPRAKVKPESDAWLRPMRLLIADRDDDVAEVESVLRWCQQDSFWQSNILSPSKLREKFTQLSARMQTSTSLAPSAAPGATAAPTRWAQRGAEWAAEEAQVA